MPILKKQDLLNRYSKSQSVLLNEADEKSFAQEKLSEGSKDFSYTKGYDIFLSHSYDDSRIVKILKEMLEGAGWRVYVDWIEDNRLNRSRVTPGTAGILRRQMNSCESLIYLTSQAAVNSLWMPWELGYMDAKTGRVAVAPILDEHEDFEGREYLGLYPYLDLTSDSFYIHRNPDKWVGFTKWMAGENPIDHG